MRIVSRVFKKIIAIIVIFNLIGFLTSCGGSKVLKEPKAIQVTQPLVTETDQQVSASLNWVIVRNGPGTWAKNADWDEYLISVFNETENDIQIIDVIIVDSLGTRLTSNSDRKELVKDSKETIKRYKDSELKVKAGMSGNSMIGTGFAVATVGAPVTGLVAGSIVGGWAGLGVATVAVGGGLLVGPALVVGGIVRSKNNSKVAQEIERRHTVFPVTVVPHESVNLDIFFPLAPSPKQLEVSYILAEGGKNLIMSTNEALNGLHLFQEEK